MYLDERTTKILDVLSKKIKRTKKSITSDSIRIFAYLYGQYLEDNDIIFRDKNNNEAKLQFKDFLNVK